MRKDLDNARESGPPVLPERERTFFVANNLKWGCFRGQGMDKRRVQPLARGAYYIGLYDEIFFRRSEPFIPNSTLFDFYDLSSHLALN